MERTITVYHEGAIAHYNVAKQTDGTFKARLLQYSGANQNKPPSVLELQRQGSHWNKNENTYENLVEELGVCIQMQGDVFENTTYPKQDNR
jgi:hypothetical protein